MIPNKLTGKNLGALIQQEFGKEGFSNVPLEDCITETGILDRILNRILSAPCPWCDGKRIVTSLKSFTGEQHCEPMKEACPCCDGFGAIILVRGIDRSQTYA
ncbi:MAG: hypothetical protein UY48_C0042G0006 [Candidatus Gottesmanbacteria bacterium GW2011_GWB1_49_7]|uniref:Uncharacterized protein n=1 Tax=Candidatus Gottesmanbacteria bacterium GW2011_GWB1_49_7 TaxID=1618448 RepID=A0A0G1YV90_9BACT|nr:MAG: hypothetical protein UY48_C0042G0006 [Candidatus Gottesmanbacteria bacterium GW2011_GWB1_49_7]